LTPERNSSKKKHIAIVAGKSCRRQLRQVPTPSTYFI
jgi:hypothetical protein